jgi:hypothetical protein
MVTRATALVCGVAILLGLFGCGKGGQEGKDAPQEKDAPEKLAPEETPRGKELKKLGLAYHGYQGDYGRGPADLKTFRQWAQAKDPDAVPVIDQTGQGGTYALLYGAYNFAKDFPSGVSNTVLAYELEPSPGGRIVLIADGSVKVMSEPAFAAAVRPGVTDVAKAPGGRIQVDMKDNRATVLIELGQYYLGYQERHKGQGPASRAELGRLLGIPPKDAPPKDAPKDAPTKGLPPDPRAELLAAIGPGPYQFTFYFGCERDASFPAGLDKTVLAYENQPAPGRRLVLTADGKAWRMTEEAFAKAPRPKTDR